MISLGNGILEGGGKLNSNEMDACQMQDDDVNQVSNKGPNIIEAREVKVADKLIVEGMGVLVSKVGVHVVNDKMDLAKKISIGGNV